MDAISKVAVAGATGRVGHHVVGALQARGFEVVSISRSQGVDVISGEGLAEALAGVEAIVDATTGPSPEYKAASGFFTAAARNLHEAGERAGVKRLVIVSIIGADRFQGGYNAAKVDHERAALAGPLPARILRAAQFHEFVEQLIAWGRQGDVSYLPEIRTQLVAARAVGEALAKLATASPLPEPTVTEIAGPRAESLVEMAGLFAARRGDPARVETAGEPSDADGRLMAAGGLLPGPGAALAGPTFEEWLAETDAARFEPATARM